jgi:prepilin-type N-terminal cleavage/methylation domain-containing protein
MIMAKKALRKFWKKENKGFTLVELIIVIAIIAILIAILVPNYVRYVEKSRWNNDQNQMETLIGEVNTAATETLEAGKDVLKSGTSGTITVTKSSNATVSDNISKDMAEALAKTDKQFTVCGDKAVVADSLRLKNNGKHGGDLKDKDGNVTGKGGTSKYTITIKVNGDDIDVTGEWGEQS